MKRTISILLIALLSVSLFACGKKVNETQPSHEVSDTEKIAPVSGDFVKIVEIVDIAKRDEIPCAQAIEWFYEDSAYKYYYPSIKSKYVLVRYSDGSKETAENALKNGTISLSDLDKFDIVYYKEKK